MGKKRHPEQLEFKFRHENEVPLGDVLDNLEEEFDREEFEEDEEDPGSP